jgi:DNA polymerase (family 10)
MFRSTFLAPSHYAGKWIVPAEEQRNDLAAVNQLGYVLLRETGSVNHLAKVEALSADGLKGLLNNRDLGSEEAIYAGFHMQFVEPEIREGRDEVKRAKELTLPELVREPDVRGDLHTHTFAGDGSHSIEQMASHAQERGYEYLGITDHSQSLKIAGGVLIADLWKQIVLIDKVNDLGLGIRVLKSAEVDILTDGSLDYLDEVLRKLDYTVCSIY